ncbi:MAG: hypothetical protein EA383_00760 [Spirochaetaceae bacterium]|nr:MAG: hypothetical protein EA383_00760 [Spirochaetaceae bacterium]
MRGTTAGVRRWAAGLKAGLIVATTVLLSLTLLVGCDFLGALFGLEVDPYEPNDSIADAYPIELGESYTAYISENDADFFSFRPAHGADTYDEVEIRVTDTGSDLRIGLALYDPQGERFAARTVNTKGANLTYTLATPGLNPGENFYVRFSGTWGVGGWEVDGYGDYHTQGPYTFRVRNLNANDEFAPNHTMGTAHPITVGQSYDGVIVSRYERDFFEFVAESTSMSFDVIAGGDLKVGVVVYNSGGSVIRSETVNTSGANLSVTWEDFDVGATYYVRFNGTWGKSGWIIGGSEPGTGTGDANSRGPYTFVVSNN